MGSLAREGASIRRSMQNSTCTEPSSGTGPADSLAALVKPGTGIPPGLDPPPSWERAADRAAGPNRRADPLRSSPDSDRRARGLPVTKGASSSVVDDTRTSREGARSNGGAGPRMKSQANSASVRASARAVKVRTLTPSVAPEVDRASAAEAAAAADAEAAAAAAERARIEATEYTSERPTSA